MTNIKEQFISTMFLNPVTEKGLSRDIMKFPPNKPPSIENRDSNFFKLMHKVSPNLNQISAIAVLHKLMSRKET